MQMRSGMRRIALTLVALYGFIIALEACGDPPPGENSIINETTDSHGVALSVYTCRSGHYYRWGSTVLRCNATGSWTLDSGPDENSTSSWYDCEKRSTYIGCLEINSTLINGTSIEHEETSLNESENREGCLQFCHDLNFPFAARQASKCVCIDSISHGIARDNNLCYDYCADMTSFCGNFGIDVYSVYRSIDVADCGEPPQGENAAISLVDPDLGTQSGQRAVYTCNSGHYYKWGSTVLRCNATGTWTLDSGPDWNSTSSWYDCKERATYQGCMEINGTMSAGSNIVRLETSSFEHANREGCLEFCRELSFSFAARQGPNCMCMASISEMRAKDNFLCSELCADGTSYCGNSNTSLYSVYKSIDECVTLTHPPNHTQTAMYSELTCKQFCRGQDSLVAFWRGGLEYCDCFDLIPAYTDEKESNCETAERTGEETLSGRLFITELLHPLSASSCEDIFKLGIFIHGHYYLSDGSKVYCNFYDGSATCERGWVSHASSCYLFLSEEAGAHQHFNTCATHGSLLVSVSDQEEWDFLSESMASLEHMAGLAAYIGLYDTQKTFSYMWSDETAVTLRKFNTGYPYTVDNRCIVLVSSLMQNVFCDDHYGAVCERSPAMVGCLPMDPSSADASISSSRMTIPLCFENCRSEGKDYSLTHGEECFCRHEIASVANSSADWSNCNVRCPANDFQICGGNITDHVFVIRDVGQPYRTDCRDMVLGSVLANATILNSVTGEPEVVDCREVVGVNCPDSWIEVNGRCYRFFPERAPSAHLMCNSIGGYTAVYETDQEAEIVQQTIQDTTTLSAVGLWLFGLYKQRLTGSKVRFTNGAFVNSSLRSLVADLEGAYCFAHRSDNVWDIRAVVCDSCAFICETGNDYLGCHRNPSTHLREIIVYPATTVTQCKETCKGVGKPFAAVKAKMSCYCTDEGDLVKATPESLCKDHCATGQICGTSGYYTTVYRLDFNDTADSCEDLFNQGVLLNGRYLLSGGLTWCGMKDSDYLRSQIQLCTEGQAGCELDYMDHSWQRVGVGSLNLAVDSTYLTEAATLQTRCDGVYNPATILAPARTQAAIDLITEVLEWSLDRPVSRPAFIGLVDEFTMGVFSYSDGSIFRMDDVFPNAFTSGELKSYFLNPSSKTHVQITETGVFQLFEPSSDPEHVVCQRDAAYMGCYTTTNTNSLGANINGYQSMTLTACRQVCQGQGSTTLLISATDCVCSNVTHLMSKVLDNTTGCSLPCPGSKYQHCGGATHYRMYTFESDAATSCQELYDNFVLLPSIYSINGEPTACGLDDLSAACPPAYIAASGICYRPNPRQDVAGSSAHAQACASQGGHLASPITESELEALVEILGSFSSFKDLELWRLGYWDIFSASSYSTANGHMLPRDNNITRHLKLDADDQCVAVNKTSGLLQAVSCSTPLPFVCQAYSATSGCALRNTSGDPAASLRLNTSMTVQQCVAFCKGDNPLHRFALLQAGLCLCEPSDTPLKFSPASEVTCGVVCPGDSLQQCGSSQSEYFSVYDIETYRPEFLQHSCEDLLTFGVIALQQYVTDKDETFSCYKYSDKSTFVLAEQLGDQAQPLTVMNFSNLALNGWTPTVSGSPPEVTFVLDSLYVIEGIVTTGNLSSIAVWTSTDGTLYEIHPDNQNVSVKRTSGMVSWSPLPATVVAFHIRLSLTSWAGTSDTISFELIGYDYGLQDFSDYFLGCFNSPVVAHGSGFLADPDVKFCLDSCNSTRYVTLRENGTGASECQCVELMEPRDPFGPINTGHRCNATCTGGLRCSSSASDEVAIYKRSDFSCELLPRPRLRTSTVLPDGLSIAVNGSDFPLGTQLTLTCDLGYEFNETGPENVSSVCANSNGWGLSDDAFQCFPVDCGPFPNIPGAVITTTDDNSTVYNSSVRYACASPIEAFGGTEASWEMTCNHTKQWLPAYPTCEPIPCVGDPPTVAMATSNASLGTNFTVGTIILYECEEDTMFLAANTTTATAECVLPGNWSEVNGTCTKYRCSSQLPAVANSSVVPGLSDFDASYHCNEGLTFSDRSKVKAVSCNATSFEWEVLTDECKEWKVFQSHACLAYSNMTASGPSLGQWATRGVLRCGHKCLGDLDCITFSFSKTVDSGQINCRTYGLTASNLTVTGGPGWNVYSFNDDC